MVGGSLRDLLEGRPATDWDLTTSALPEITESLFPGAVYENQFGTVAVRSRDRAVGDVEITTFRSDHDYADYRRPHRVEFGDSIEVDLARRDFTVNAMAWGAEPGSEPRFVDPYDGRADLAARTLRAVGDPATRFGEDALRMVRAVRLAATLDFTIEPATLAAIGSRAELVSHLSGERIGAEMRKLLAAPLPSTGLRPLFDTGLLAHLAPELAAQRGVPQNKVPGEDLWDHTLRAVDGAARSRRASGWRPCCTIWASHRRWLTAGSSATRSSAPSRPANCSIAGAGRPPSGSAWSISSATTCSGTCRPGPTLRSVGSS